MNERDKDLPFSFDEPDESLDKAHDHNPGAEQSLSHLEDDGGFEEPDRDTDFASLYAEDEAYFEEDLEREELDSASPGVMDGEPPASEDELDDTEPPFQDEPDEVDWEQDTDPITEQFEPVHSDSARYDTFSYQEEGDPNYRQWPLGLLIVGAIALLLLAAGGYGVIQQRSAMEEEIRQLQASLATSASPQEVNETRSALQTVEARNADLQNQLESLAQENRRLTDTVATLESRLDSAEQALSKAAAQVTAAKKATPSTPATVKPAPSQVSRPVAASGNWFVNFGSYSQKSTADSWQQRLEPSAGKTAVTLGEKDGKTFYRVRVVGLASREAAQRVARELEAEYRLSKLWVGKQP